MSGSAKAGTTAERHTCELRVLIASIVRAPPKRASGESFSPLTKDLHGCRQTGSYRSTRKSPCSPVICTHRLHAARMYASGAIWRKMSPPRNLSIIRIRAGGQCQGGGTMAQRRQRGWLKKETRIQGETWVLYFRTTRKSDGTACSQSGEPELHSVSNHWKSRNG